MSYEDFPTAEDDAKRRKEIEYILNTNRDAYFRSPTMPKEYYDILERQEGRDKQLTMTPGPFDEALARFKADRASGSDRQEQQYDQVASNDATFVPRNVPVRADDRYLSPRERLDRDEALFGQFGVERPETAKSEPVRVAQSGDPVKPGPFDAMLSSYNQRRGIGPAAVNVAQNTNAPAPPQKSEAEREIDRLPVTKRAIEDAFTRKGLNPVWGKLYASRESSGNPNKITGTKRGLFQLSDEVFRKYGSAGNPLDPSQNATAAADWLKAGYLDFVRKYQREPSVTELFLSHNQGAGGFEAHYKNPDQLAWKSMRFTGEGKQIARKLGSEAADNWARKAVWDNVPGDLKRKYQIDLHSLTSRQLFDLWKEKLEDDGRYGTFFSKVPGAAEDWEGRPVDLYSAPRQFPLDGSQSYSWQTDDARTLGRMRDAREMDAKLRSIKKFPGGPR